MTEDWAEAITLLLLVTGFMIAMLSDAAIITYAMAILCGIAIGSYYMLRKSGIRFAFYMISFGFYLGFVIGVNAIDRGYFLLTTGFFIFGIWLGKWLYAKGYFK